MKYILTGLLLIAFTSCGSDNNNKETDVKKAEVVKETSPQNIEKSKTPPAIPKI